jgi:predicted nucleic acid-binding protein
MNGKVPVNVVFDTNSLLGYLKSVNGWPDLREIFPDPDLFISEITEIELLSFWNIGPDEEANIRHLLADLVIVPLRPEIKQETIILRRATRCTTPDAIIAATAVFLDAELVTHDKKLLNIAYPGLRLFTASP